LIQQCQGKGVRTGRRRISLCSLSPTIPGRRPRGEGAGGLLKIFNAATPAALTSIGKNHMKYTCKEN
jgi:hypothetical protein